MQLILKALSHPAIGEIVIRDRLFPIGRHEPPFESFQDEAVARLSRRHARIFIQDHAVYLVDLDSMNGTTINGEPLDKHSRQLQQGDEICFAGQLSFGVLLDGGDTSSKQSYSSIILTLLPEQLQTILEPIVVAEFPFLLSKSDDLFARYSKRIPDQYKFLSRRHAHFFVRDNNLMIEDLGSTNGTFVSGSRLDEHARVLHDGDTVAFGGNDFIYRAHIKIIERNDGRMLDKSDLITEALNTSNEVTRTTFVTSANSFIDIFCAQDEEDDHAYGQEAIEDGANYNRHNTPGQGRTNGLTKGKQKGRLSIFLAELRRAFLTEEKPARRYGVWVVLGVFSLAAVMIGLTYLQSAAKRSIEQLLEDGAYVHGIVEADAYLAHHPNDREIEEMALRAASLHILPDWEKYLTTGDFDKARKRIEELRDIATQNRHIKPFLDMLEWLTTEEEFFTQRGSSATQIVLYQDEKTITELIDWWDRNSTEHQRITNRIVQYVPTFEAINALALSHLRTLRNEQSLYLVAIDEMKIQLDKLLENDLADDIERLLSEFTAKYPRISGVNHLLTDLSNYREVQRTINKFAWIDTIGLLDNINFLTPPFRSKAATIRSKHLPPMTIATEYQLAAELWQQGEGEKAIGTLQGLTQGEWGEMARQILDHRLLVWNEYQKIIESKQDADYPIRLLTFYETLDKTDDTFFLASLKPEYQAHQKKILDEAKQSFTIAKSSWKAYQKNGRISGLMRLEASISRHYSEQARRLSDALEKSSNAIGIYRLLHIEPPTEQQAVYHVILQESRLQRQSIEELRMVLDAKLFEGKIGLLPITD